MKISKDLVNKIADNLEAGEKYFLHKKTHAIVAYPEDYIIDLDPENECLA